MEQLAPSHWPPGNRTGYCYAPSSRVTDREDCDMKYGNPFGPFWNVFSVDFNRSEFTRMSYTINKDVLLERWKNRFVLYLNKVKGRICCPLCKQRDVPSLYTFRIVIRRGISFQDGSDTQVFSSP